MRVRAADDRTARAVIRDEALRLFAERGPDRVRLREIAAAADVSPGLIMHHYGSLEGLRDAVDDHVLATFESLLAEATAEGPEIYDPAANGSIAANQARRLPPESLTLPWMIAPVESCEGTCCAIAVGIAKSNAAMATSAARRQRRVLVSMANRDMSESFTIGLVCYSRFYLSAY